MHKAINRFAILTLNVLVIASFAACDRSSGSEGSGSKTSDNAVAATVNGKSIALSEVDRVLSQQARGQQAQMSPLQLAAARLQVLDGLVQQEILFQRAEKEKLLPTEDDVSQAINAQKQQNRLTEEEYQKFLRDSNQTEQGVREVIRKQITIQKLQDKMIGQISINDKEVEDFYNNNKQLFVNIRGVGLAGIVVDPKDNGVQDDAKNDAEAKLKIDGIYQRLKSGADFATVARASSEDPSNLRGGDLGFATEDQLRENRIPAALTANFFGAMQVGDITAPVRLDDGRWFVFKVTDKRLQSENLTLDSPGVRDKIKEDLITQRRALLNAALLSIATNEAKVANNLAQNMLNSPSNLSGLRPAPAGGATGSPTVASPTASPVANPVANPVASPVASPAASTTASPSPPTTSATQ